MTQDGNVPKVWSEWKSLMDGLLALPQPATKEDIEKHVQSLGYDLDAVLNAMVSANQILLRIFGNNEETTDDAD